MALQTTIKFQQFAAFPPPSRRRSSRRILIHPKFLNSSPSCASMASRSDESRSSSSSSPRGVSSSPLLVCSFAGRRVTFRSSSRLRASTNTTTTTGKLNSYDNDDEDGGGPSLMTLEERHEWRTKIRQVLDASPDVEEEVDLSERTRKMQKLLADYPLVVEEEDPEWPDDADGRGFNLDQFFNKITIKNVKKKEEELYDDDSDNELVWQDDDYIRPIKDITTAEWEEAVFKDISPLIVLVHNRYKRPKENEKFRDELEKAVQIIWNCRLPSPRCVAVDAVVEVDLVSALKVSIFPEMVFTSAGKILYREKAHRTADELSKIMAFFYYGASKPPCLNSIGNFQEAIPSVPINSQT